MSRPAFEYPAFFDYPPYFTLQPNPETCDRQSVAWQALILSYCQSQKVFIVSTAGGDQLPLFVNTSINRQLSREGKVRFLGDLVAQGRASWLDKQQSRCLILWKSLENWTSTISDWIQDTGHVDSVVALEDLSSGDDVTATELEGLPREILLPALKLLEAKGRVRLFKGVTAEEEGVKFLK